MRRIATLGKENHVKALAAMTLLATCQASLAAEYEVELKAQVENLCVLPTPTAAGDGEISLTENKADVKTLVGPDGRAESTRASLEFKNAYCNGGGTIELRSGGNSSALLPTGGTVPAGFAGSIEYTATATWGTAPAVTISPDNPSVNAPLQTPSGDISLVIDIFGSDLPLHNQIYADSVYLTVSVLQ